MFAIHALAQRLQHHPVDFAAKGWFVGDQVRQLDAQ